MPSAVGKNFDDINVGILALQGAVDPHVRKLEELGAKVTLVRKPADLKKIDAIILPGGESSTMIKLIDRNGLWDDLQEFVNAKPAWGVCAGAILLAHTVSHPEQKSLGAIDMEVERNAYGRQLQSFITDELEWRGAGDAGAGQEGVFIRAPKIKNIGKNVDVLYSYRDEVVMVSDGQTLASCFHPELSPGARIHELFLTSVRHYLGQ